MPAFCKLESTKPNKVRRTHILLTSILFLSLPLYSQNGYPPSGGARGVAMGFTGVVFQDIHSSFRNQAGLAFLEGWSVMAQVEQRFITSDIRMAGLAAAVPTSVGTFGLNIQYYGVSLYNEQRFGLNYAMQLAEGFSLGAQFDLFSIRIEEYGQKWFPTFELGFQAAITSDLRIGGHVFNPLRIEVVQEELIPTIISAGLSYAPGDQALLVLEIEKDIDRPVRVKGAIEYFLLDRLPIRLGIATQPASITFGIGFYFSKNIGVQAASAWNSLLGFSPSFSADYTHYKP